jgi:hypothetical protein
MNQVLQGVMLGSLGIVMRGGSGKLTALVDDCVDGENRVIQTELVEFEGCQRCPELWGRLGLQRLELQRCHGEEGESRGGVVEWMKWLSGKTTVEVDV